MTSKCLIPVLLVLLLTTAHVHAADLTLFSGVQRPGKLTLADAAPSTSLLLDPRSFGTFGVRLSQGSVFGGEQTFAYSPNFISSDNSAFIFNSNLIVHIPLEVVRPYATAGLGTVRIGGEDLLRGAKFALNYGGGAKFRLAGALGGQVDVRGYTLPSVLDETLHVLEVSAGLVFSF